MCHCGMTDGATLKVTPIHKPDATDVSTLVAVGPLITSVTLAAVATAPPDVQLQVNIAVEFAPGRPIERMTR